MRVDLKFPDKPAVSEGAKDFIRKVRGVACLSSTDKQQLYGFMGCAGMLAGVMLPTVMLWAVGCELLVHHGAPTLCSDGRGRTLSWSNGMFMHNIVYKRDSQPSCKQCSTLSLRSFKHRLA